MFEFQNERKSLAIHVLVYFVFVQGYKQVRVSTPLSQTSALFSSSYEMAMISHSGLHLRLIMNHHGVLRTVLILALKVPRPRRSLHSRPNGMAGHTTVTSLPGCHDDILTTNCPVCI